MKTQFIIGLFSVLLLSAIAVITGTTTTTQIQPAYSQASHCQTDITGREFCVTPGRNPSLTVGTNPPIDLTHQQAGQAIARCHGPEAGTAECTVTHP